jgi:hypothetical protein
LVAPIETLLRLLTRIAGACRAEHDHETNRHSEPGTHTSERSKDVSRPSTTRQNRLIGSFPTRSISVRALGTTAGMKEKSAVRQTVFQRGTEVLP